MDQKKIGKFITKLRKEKKLTQTELGDKLGVSYKAVSKWENGINMPDVSLFKPLCDIFNISINELINGEKDNDDDKESNSEKVIIKVINDNQKSKKKINILVIIICCLILLFSILFILSITLYKNKYPKIDIYNLEIVENNEKKINDKLTFSYNNRKIYFYGIDSLQISDFKNNSYDLKTALIYKQISIEKLKSYFNSQYNNGNIERYILYDGGTTIYKHKNYSAIFCNTIEGNKDVYFGIPNIENYLKGEYCGHKVDETCYFTRTYHVVSIIEDDDEDYINITLKEFQGNSALVRINKTTPIQAGKDYEFTFFTYEVFDDTITNIFENSTLSIVKETDKTGLDQINDKICVNK